MLCISNFIFLELLYFQRYYFRLIVVFYVCTLFYLVLVCTVCSYIFVVDCIYMYCWYGSLCRYFYFLKFLQFLFFEGICVQRIVREWFCVACVVVVVGWFFFCKKGQFVVDYNLGRGQVGGFRLRFCCVEYRFWRSWCGILGVGVGEGRGQRCGSGGFACVRLGTYTCFLRVRLVGRSGVVWVSLEKRVFGCRSFLVQQDIMVIVFFVFIVGR